MLRVTEGQTNKSAVKSLKHLNARTRMGIDKALREERIKLERHTNDSFEERKTGKVYKVYRGRNNRRLKRGRLHQASSETQTPAILTGQLSKSLGFQMRRGSILVYGANTPYARRWEQSRRTYLLRSIKARKMDIFVTTERSIKKEIKRK